MYAIDVQNVSKNFKHFQLKDISLQLEEGFIMGLIGSNGAGKTTLIKLLMGLYIKDQGSITVLGQDPLIHPDVRDHIGFIYDNPNFYDFKLRKITSIIKPFYKQWDDQVYHTYMERFKLYDKLRFKTLSRGMKLKYALAIALSHHARLLILDEPTSGLDPVFRNEFLSILQQIMTEENLSIFFSSHITSDIEKIADYITYIKNGQIVFSWDQHMVLEAFQVIKGTEEVPLPLKDHIIGIERSPYNYTALIHKHRDSETLCQEVSTPTLEEIMYFHERGD